MTGPSTPPLAEALAQLTALAGRAGTPAEQNAAALVSSQMARAVGRDDRIDLAEAEEHLRELAVADRSRLGRALTLVLGALDQARGRGAGGPPRIGAAVLSAQERRLEG